MNTEIVVVGEDATRGEVVDYIRFHEISLDQLDNVVLINHDGALAGTVPIARLLLADSEQRMAELALRAARFRAARRQRQRSFRTFRQVQSAQPDGGRRGQSPHRRDHGGRRGEPHAREAVDLASSNFRRVTPLLRSSIGRFAGRPLIVEDAEHRITNVTNE